MNANLTSAVSEFSKGRGERISKKRALQNDICSRNRIVVYVDYSAHNNAGLWLGVVGQRSGLRLNLGET